MPVDRIRRDAAAEILAAYLRREMHYEAADEKLYALGDTSDDRSLSETAREFEVVHISKATAEGLWNRLRRYLAFLKSDLPWKPLTLDYEQEWKDRERLLAAWHLLALVVACVFAAWFSWWILVTAYPLLFLSNMATMNYYVPKRERQQRQQDAFRPFDDEAQWLAHEHLLDSCGLPSFEESRLLPEKAPSGQFARLRQAAFDWSLYAVIAFFFVALALTFFPIWPIWLVVTACKPQAVS